MSSTDKAFIKAFEAAAWQTVATEASQRRSYIIGSNMRRVTEYLAGVTDPLPELVAIALPAADVPAEEPPPSAAAKPDTDGRPPLVELRIDAVHDPVVPPPHTPVAAFTAAAQRRAARPIPSQQPHPIRPRTDSASVAQPAQPAKFVRVDRGHDVHHNAGDGQVSPTTTTRSVGARRESSTGQPARVSTGRPQGRPPLTATASFDAAWEVDAFRWPAICRRLDSLQSPPLHDFVRGILAEAWQGSRVVAVTQFERGEGATTLSLCLAKWAANFTGRVALVDGDVLHPAIAESLGLSFRHGWEETSPSVSLAEVAVQSIGDRLVVVPLGEKAGILAADSDREFGSGVLQRLAECFELVVLDAGPMYDAAHHWFTAPSAAQIDRVLVVQDVRRTEVPQVNDVRRRLTAQGLENISVVENFQQSQLSLRP